MRYVSCLAFNVQNSCGTTVQNALSKVAGVVKAEASYADAEAKVWGTASVADLIDAVECVGFDATEKSAVAVTCSFSSSSSSSRSSSSSSSIIYELETK